MSEQISELRTKKYQLTTVHRFRVNMVHIRQSTPDDGCGVEITAPKSYQVVPVSLARGAAKEEERV
jgi:hypothetical protein